MLLCEPCPPPCNPTRCCHGNPNSTDKFNVQLTMNAVWYHHALRPALPVMTTFWMNAHGQGSLLATMVAHTRCMHKACTCTVVPFGHVCSKRTQQQQCRPVHRYYLCYKQACLQQTSETSAITSLVSVKVLPFHLEQACCSRSGVLDCMQRH